MPVKRYFVDEVNPADEELKGWACSDAEEPYEDFGMVIAAPEHMSARAWAGS